MSEIVEPETADASSRAAKRGLIRDVILYSGARLLLVVAITTAIIFGAKIFDVTVPPFIAAIFALVIALPVSMMVFTSLRKRVNEGIAAVDEHRRSERMELRAKLRGDR
ncbi:MAG: DUF4229 domain-containing protein [Mycobacteriaceae bacterium]